MAPYVKLVYFPLRARAEIIRLTLEAGGVEYEEELISFETWPNRKPRKCVLSPLDTTLSVVLLTATFTQ